MNEFLTVFACVFTFVFGLFIGMTNQKLVPKSEAIKSGVAEYYLDENNNKQFRWKTDKPIPVPE